MKKILLVLIPLFLLVSCGKKKEEDLKPYIETITNGQISCYRVVNVKQGMFELYHQRADNWTCSDGTIKTF